jgi:hypothetical protein
MTQPAAATGPAHPPVLNRIDALFTRREPSECATADRMGVRASSCELHERRA